MLHHHVLIECTADATAEQRRALVDALRSLPARIPQIASYEVHEDAGLAQGNAHVSIVASFADEAAFRAYVEHPEHVAVVTEHITPIKAGLMRLQHA